MNRNNLSWVDNKVFSNQGPTQNTAPQMRPYTDTAPTQYQSSPDPAAVSPATYQGTNEKPPAAMPSAVSPETYQDATAGSSSPTGMMPGAVMGAAGAGYGMPMPGAGTGMATPGTGTGMGMPSTLTRDLSYAPSPISVQGPPTVLDPGYIPAYLRTQIGKRVRAEFNIGTNMYMDRTGILREVGISYFILEDTVTHVRVMCDLYSLKFLTTEP